MKYLLPCFLLLPFVSSCDVAQGGYYYESGYQPAPPRVEVHRFDERLPQRHHHGHRIVQSEHSHHGGHPVIVQPHQSPPRLSHGQNAHRHEDHP